MQKEPFYGHQPLSQTKNFFFSDSQLFQCCFRNAQQRVEAVNIDSVRA